jgi:hypothetical protein
LERHGDYLIRTCGGEDLTEREILKDEFLTEYGAIAEPAGEGDWHLAKPYR